MIPFESTVGFFTVIFTALVSVLRHWRSSSEQNELLVLLELVFQWWEKDECWTWRCACEVVMRTKEKKQGGGIPVGEGVAIFWPASGESHLKARFEQRPGEGSSEPG